MNRCLVIVDVQNGFLNNLGQMKSNYLERLNNFLVKHHSDYSRIFYTQFYNKETSNFVKQLDYRDMCLDNKNPINSDINIYDFSLKKENIRVLPKCSYGVDIKNILSEQIVTSDTIFDILGMDTDGCVMAVCFNLFDAGFTINIIEDLCASSGGKKYHEAGLFCMKRSFGDKHFLNSSDEILAKTNLFRH